MTRRFLNPETVRALVAENMHLRREGLPPLASMVDVQFYLAAPYSAPTREDIEGNVAWAIHWWSALTRAGYHVNAPHVSDLLDTTTHGAHPPLFYYGYTMRQMERCDAVVLIPDRIGGSARRDSKGTCAEIVRARALAMPVYDASELLTFEEYHAASAAQPVAMRRCPTCRGTGEVEVIGRALRRTEQCPECKGAKEVAS